MLDVVYVFIPVVMFLFGFYFGKKTNDNKIENLYEKFKVLLKNEIQSRRAEKQYFEHLLLQMEIENAEQRGFH